MQIESNLTILLVAGVDTTSLALGFAIKELSNNKKYEQMLIDEVDRFGRNKDIKEEDLDKFIVSKAVFYESVRLNSVIRIYRNQSLENFTLVGKKVPKGTTLVMPFRAIHLNEKFWPKAKEFHPTRFLVSKYCSLL